MLERRGSVDLSSKGGSREVAFRATLPSENMIYGFLKWLKAGTSDETNGRHIISIEATKACHGIKCPHILDVGAGYGYDLRAIGDLLQHQSKLFAVETYPGAVKFLSSVGINVRPTNVERDPLPFPDQCFDVVICNQVLEHVKEIFWVVSELTRVTKVGGHLILGVPNLGSLHNRALLLFGQQPAAIQVFGPHVRGYTVPGMLDFLERGNVLKVRKVLGGNFYPLPPRLSRALSTLLPQFSVSSFYVAERVTGGDFLAILSAPESLELVDTPYYRGPGLAASH